MMIYFTFAVMVIINTVCLCTRETNSTGGVYLVGTEKVRQNRF